MHSEWGVSRTHFLPPSPLHQLVALASPLPRLHSQNVATVKRQGSQCLGFPFVSPNGYGINAQAALPFVKPRLPVHLPSCHSTLNALPDYYMVWGGGGKAMQNISTAF